MGAVEKVCGSLSTNLRKERKPCKMQRLRAAAMKEKSLGAIGNSIAGLVGGGVGGQLLSMVLGGGAMDAAGGMDIGGIVSQIAGGGVGGAFVMVIICMIKKSMAK